MDTRRLIDAIVQQTASLVAELATAAGIRAPLSHVADHVFLRMARELEQKGVARKVAADMFGLTLRSYQKKLRRLLEERTAADRSLWQAMVSFLRTQGTVARNDVLHRFRRDDEQTVAAILRDLVQSGLLKSTGRGDEITYRFVEPAEQDEDARAIDVLTARIWMSVDRQSAVPDELMKRFNEEDGAAVESALQSLVQEGLVEETAEGTLRATQLVVPVGAEHGWEGAVFDHFRAVLGAIAAKVAEKDPARRELLGGATLSFDLHENHPYKEEVEGLLERVRGDVNSLWDKVSAYNRDNLYRGEGRKKLYFYVGQNIEDIE